MSTPHSERRRRRPAGDAPRAAARRPDFDQRLDRAWETDALTARLTLICHGPTAATRARRFPRDEPLETGTAALPSAMALAVGRAGRRLTAPAPAARHTAARFDLAFAEDDGLRDLETGRWAGRNLAAVAAEEPQALAAWMTDPTAAPHGGESVAALLVRAETWMEGQAGLGGRIAAVTHPAWVRAAVVAALGAGPASFWRVEAPPLSVVSFSHDGRRWTLSGLVPP